MLLQIDVHKRLVLCVALVVLAGIVAFKEFTPQKL